MRRQTKPQGLAARWPLRPLDIDPFRLPVQYSLPVVSATGQASQACDRIEIGRNAIAVEHAGAGLPAVRRRFAFEDFSGVAVRIEPLGDAGDGYAVSVNLHHPDPKLCFPLHVSLDMMDVGARWQSWARALKLPLLLPAPDGSWREPIARLGKLAVNRPYPRSARLALKGRRSVMSSLREMGAPGPMLRVCGAEIIARN